jgi:predicted nucleic acid-binding Zn ribbon protein
MAKQKESERRNSTISVKEALREMLNSYKLEGKFSQKHLIGSWEQLMGKPVAKRTTKVFFKGNVLMAEINSSPLKQEMNSNKAKILHMLQKEYGKEVIEEIIFY